MKRDLQSGERKTHTFQVRPEDHPDFSDGGLHEVCSTYKLAREIEWSTRLFVNDILEPDEEGFGTFLSITHSRPAFDGEQVYIEAMVKSMVGNEVICTYEARVGDRLVATGETGQKVLKKDKIKEIFSRMQS